ncbi:Pre-mRNA-processing-splicing factor 8A [Gracilariopsis chorda]|uniref:Pre-mRNA-processing-splicing factor 8A n=1 Tax=Gracilariopsis chorda TaxID=448386 RepID=A0A2V3IEM9_9FLOR|nr:Pre-mRNA-processing-splicing factor 8A [Gracilariopsis chorda]|eukprot:PXF40527.1 Pre-mRNA-processing-splicing factor 8A [Gracilariopsis chorda]
MHRLYLYTQKILQIFCLTWLALMFVFFLERENVVSDLVWGPESLLQTQKVMDFWTLQNDFTKERTVTAHLRVTEQGIRAFENRVRQILVQTTTPFEALPDFRDRFQAVADDAVYAHQLAKARQRAETSLHFKKPTYQVGDQVCVSRKFF